MGGCRLTITPDDRDRPRTGFTVGVTAARRADRVRGPAGTARGRGAARARDRIIPLVDDEELRHATESVVADPPDIVVATTGIGFRGWIEAADGWGLADDLIDKPRRHPAAGPGPEGHQGDPGRRTARAMVAAERVVVGTHQ